MKKQKETEGDKEKGGGGGKQAKRGFHMALLRSVG